MASKLIRLTSDHKKAKGGVIKKGTVLRHFGKPNFDFELADVKKEEKPKKAKK